MIQSTHNPAYAHMSDAEVQAEYVRVFKTRDTATMSDEQLDAIESLLFWLDDELCARGLDLPC